MPPRLGLVKEGSLNIPIRRSWKQALAPYLQVDRQRTLGQIATVVVPYLAVWVLAVLIEPSVPLAIVLSLVATVLLSRMYSLFHDLTHGVRARGAPGQLIPAASAPARLGRRQRQLPPRPPPQREDPELPPPRRARIPSDVPSHPGGHDP